MQYLFLRFKKKLQEPGFLGNLWGSGALEDSGGAVSAAAGGWVVVVVVVVASIFFFCKEVGWWLTTDTRTRLQQLMEEEAGNGGRSWAASWCASRPGWCRYIRVSKWDDLGMMSY